MSPRFKIVSLAMGMIVVCGFATAGSEVEAEDQQISIGFVEQFESAILGESRDLQIHLPDHHEVGTKPYPLLVVLDGGAWFNYMVSLLDMMAPNHLPEMVVVGLPNTNRRRDLDIGDESLGEPGAGARRFTRFLSEELFPHMAENYRASSYRVIAGHSLAGSFVLHTACASPGLFRGYIGTSPAMHDDKRRSILDAAYGKLQSDSFGGSFLYVSAGGAEPAEFAEALKRLNGKLGGRMDLVFHAEIHDGEGHVPIKGFYQGLRLLFSHWIPPTSTLLEADWPAVVEHYRGLSNRFGFKVDPAYDIVSLVARRMENGGDPSGAIKVLRRLVELYPDSDQARERLVRLEMAGLEGEFLGQTPPGSIPELFASFLSAPSDNKHSSLSFSLDGKELYYSVYPRSQFPQKIMVTKRGEHSWSLPGVAAFSGEHQEGGPRLSPDGSRIYYYSKRPIHESETEAKRSDIWFVERDAEGGWSEPHRLPAPVNTDQSESVRGFSSTGGMYIARYGDRKPHLLVAHLNDGGTFAEPHELKNLIFDESFLEAADMGEDDFVIIDVSKKTFGPWYNAYLYITYRNPDGSWTTPKSMGDMINRGQGRFPSLSPEGKYLFFTSYRTGRAEFYWVDAGIIDYLRSHDLDLVAQISEAVRGQGVARVKPMLAAFQREHAGYYEFDEKLLDDVARELIAEGETERAIEVLKLNLELYPTPEQSLRKAKLASLERDGEALDGLRTGLASLESLGDDDLNGWGRFLVRSSQLEAAQLMFELDREVFPWSPWAFAGLASVCQEQGDVDGARRLLNLAIGLDPANRRFRDRLESLAEGS